MCYDLDAEATIMAWPSDEDKAFLEANGWEVECCSPFEIRTKDGSFATGEAADYVLMGLKEEAAAAAAAAAHDRLHALLEAHRRFHEKSGCPGLPECYVCHEENQ